MALRKLGRPMRSTSERLRTSELTPINSFIMLIAGGSPLLFGPTTPMVFRSLKSTFLRKRIDPASHFAFVSVYFGTKLEVSVLC